MMSRFSLPRTHHDTRPFVWPFSFPLPCLLHYPRLCLLRRFRLCLIRRFRLFPLLRHSEAHHPLHRSPLLRHPPHHRPS